jgi:hypothetical protein
MRYELTDEEWTAIAQPEIQPEIAGVLRIRGMGSSVTTVDRST